ncbi:MAG: MBL fold metallo-hydrolase [Xanthomonadales bacterium]|nr:MBL fold metallo-hydrolase [Xanthomonadales bacterium]
MKKHPLTSWQLVLILATGLLCCFDALSHSAHHPVDASSNQVSKAILAARSAAATFQINTTVNDAWVTPGIPGQGFFIMVFPELGIVFLSWFTFDTEPPDGSIMAILGRPEHRWLTAAGPFEGDTATLQVEVTGGGVFNSATPVPDQVSDGTVTIEFADCNNALLTFNIPSAMQQGAIPLTRVAADNVARCEAEQPSDPVVVTYIGNHGVMIQHGGQEVIIDGVLPSLSGWVSPTVTDQNNINGGNAPYEDVEVAGLTHGHGDHVSFTAVNAFLSNQANTRFLASSSSGAGSISDQSKVQIINIPRGQQQQLTINGVPVTVIHTRHFNQFGNDFSGVTNLAFLVEIGGKKILHAGDFDYAADNIGFLGLQPGELDAIILPTFNTLISQANFNLINTLLAPGKIIAAHFQSGLIASERTQVLNLLPDAVIFDSPGEQLTLE